MPVDQIQYSEKYFDKEFEYRYVCSYVFGYGRVA